MIVERIVRKLNQPWECINYLNTTVFRTLLPDEMVVSCQFRAQFGRKLNLRAPQTFNEKLQWLKLNDRNPEYCKLVDKYEVKKIVAEKIGKEHLIPTYGIWNSADDIDFENLPNSFVLKTTHDSHSIIMCRDKMVFDAEEAKNKIRMSLKRNYFYGGREWPYKNVKPRVIAEKYMVNSNNSDLRDYKFFCFNSIPKAMFIASERFNPDKPTAFDFFDMDYNHLPIIQGHPNAEVVPDKPLNFEKMKEMAHVLSEGYPHVRVDFYEINQEVYFGEMTFFHFGGFVPFDPDKWDEIFGSWINLPK